MVVGHDAHLVGEGPDAAATQALLARYATLAAIAQAASFDTTYCADEADEAKWRELSVALRDSTAEVARQVRANDQQAAVKALGAVEKSCTDCHTAFGIE